MCAHMRAHVCLFTKLKGFLGSKQSFQERHTLFIPVFLFFHVEACGVVWGFQGLAEQEFQEQASVLVGTQLAKPFVF